MGSISRSLMFSKTRSLNASCEIARAVVFGTPILLLYVSDTNAVFHSFACFASASIFLNLRT